jgi:D-threo-aldose 1-dehydrogenase
MNPHEISRLGTTDVEVTRLGLGTAPLGGFPDPLAADVARETVREAVGAGVRLFDTAPLYGHGLSERYLGAVLPSLPRKSFSVATKVGRLLREVPLGPAAAQWKGESLYKGEIPEVNPIWDFSRAGVQASLEESLERLNLSRVDIAHIHDPDQHFREAMEGAFPALAELRDEGVIRAVGAGMNQSEMLARFAREGDFDCFLLAGRYTLFEQGALDELFPICEMRKISIVAGGVYNGGLLADPKPGVTYNYIPAPPEIVDRALALKTVCERHGIPLRAAAIQFPLAHPVVAAVVIGARAPDEVRENIELMQLPIPSELWEELRHEGLIREDAPVPM